MAYATAEQLAAALHTEATDENQQLLDDCLGAAAEEIDAFLDRTAVATPFDPVPSSIVRCNVNRAVEWYKASDAANGAVGIDQVAVLTPPPGDGFARHGLSIRSYKQQWGIG
jgi:hypothetical protein